MLTVPEVARRLNRDPETVRRWIRTGKLRAHRVGTQHIVDDEDLAALTMTPVSVPAGWMTTATGEPMPDILNAMRTSRLGR